MLFIRYVSLFVSLVGSIVWLFLAKKISLGYSLASLAWLVNLFAFHSIRLITLQKTFNVPNYFFDVSFLNSWSLSIQLQGALTLTLLGIALLSWSRKWN